MKPVFNLKTKIITVYKLLAPIIFFLYCFCILEQCQSLLEKKIQQSLYLYQFTLIMSICVDIGKQ